MLAPVVIFAYKRLNKTKKCLESLLTNGNEVAETNVFLFVDGPKNEKDKQAVNDVRNFVSTWEHQKCFKSFHITFRECNVGLANNVIAGVTEVINQYQKVIVLEDDLILSPMFLKYMNQALDYYEADDKIWSIAGYTPSLQSLKNYRHDVWLGYRASSWGWATWKDRWETVDWSMSDYEDFLRDKDKKRLFSRGGADMLGMLEMQMNGYLDSWAIRWCYAQSMQNKYTVFPKVSYIINDGHDGSGMHSGTKNMKGAKMLSDTLATFEPVEINSRITKEYYYLWADTLWRKIRRNFGMRGIKKVLRIDRAPRVGVLYICTGEYVLFWKKFYKSMKRHFLRGADVHYYVFTDSDKIYGEQNRDVHRIFQKQLGWPYDTLRRFDMFLSIEDQLNECDYLFFFNSNLVIKKKITKNEFLPTPKEKLVFTKHPGFYSKGNEEFTYERNPESTAYIPQGKGNVYVAGGLNGGEREAFLEMAKELRRRIAVDENNGIIAIYHDESQINRYVYELKDYKLLHPGFLYPEDWKIPFPVIGCLLAKSKYINVDRIKKEN